MKKHYISGTSVLLCMMLFIMPGFIEAQPGIPDAGELDWLILGPLAMPDQEEQWFDMKAFHLDYLKDLGGETKARPLAGEQTAGTVWQRLEAPGMPIDFNRVFRSREVLDAVAYAYTEFESPIVQQMALKIGSDDGLKVWFNGVLLLSHHIHRAMTPDQEALVLPVQAGKNRLLMKVDQGYGDWEMTARFRSMMEEHQEWAQAEKAGLEIHPTDQIVQHPEEFFCTVSTVPVFAVQEPIEITLTDLQGNTLHTTQGFTGTPLRLPIDKDFTGIATVRVTGLSERLAQSAQREILFGDPDITTQQVLPLARMIAATVTGQEYANTLTATVAYYADVLEGNVHPDLITEQSTIEAITRISALTAHAEQNTWGLDVFRGLHQWAYTSSIDDALQPYTLYVPDTYDPSQSYGLIVALHGYTGTDYGMASQVVTSSARPDDFLVVAPYGRGDVGYLSVGEQDVLDVMDIIQATFSIDPDRVYVMGSSMGGFGTWRMGLNFPDKFAAMAPFAGWTGTNYLENLRNLPTLIVHGNLDNSVPIGMAQQAAATLEKLGYPVRFDILDGGGHDALNVWTQATGAERIYEYFRQYRRNSWPDEVILKTSYERYGKRYWVTLIELADPPFDGYIKANVLDATHIRVMTKGVNIFQLDLTNPNLSQDEAIEIEVDGVALQADAQQNQATFRAGGDGWQLTEAISTGMVRHDGGGLGDLFMRPMMIVYGTQDRQEIYRKVARYFADWQTTPTLRVGTKTGRFHVKADVDVTDADMQNYDMLLIGGPEHNLITGKIANQLPIRFSDDGVEIEGQTIDSAGLLLTYPQPQNPMRLVTVLTLPFDDRLAEQFAVMTSVNFRAYRSDQWSASPRPFPDVAVIGSTPQQTSVLQVGWFDHAWQEIRWRKTP